MNLRSAISAMSVVGALFLLAGCGGHGSPSPTTSRSLGADDQKSAYLRFAQCMRANGQPNFPDPVKDVHGNWGFPAAVGKPVAPAACESLYRQTRSVNEGIAGPAPRNVDIAKLRDFAMCMRRHGLYDWPDPTPDGHFALPGRYAPPNGEQIIKAPLRACPQGANVKIELPRYSSRP
jgi:hypothetical protein